MQHSVSWRRHLLILALGIVSSVPCWAAEMAVLRNGFSIRHERREVIGEVTRLYVNADGSSYVDVPTAEIEHFELAAPAVEEASVRGTPKNSNVGGCPGSPNSGCLFPSVQSNLGPNLDLDQVVHAASGRYQLDPDLVNSVIKAESGFNVHAVSPKGAQGLMQLMPGTALKLGVPDAFDPQANVEGGTRYLRELLERYHFDLVRALAAYNAGPLRVEQYGGVPPYYETRAYVARIVKDFNKKKTLEEKTAAAQAKSQKSSQARTSQAQSPKEKPLQAKSKTTTKPAAEPQQQTETASTN